MFVSRIAESTLNQSINTLVCSDQYLPPGWRLNAKTPLCPKRFVSPVEKATLAYLLTPYALYFSYSSGFLA